MRILILPLPRLLHDILHQLLTDVGGVEVLDSDGSDGLAAAAIRADADLVIASEGDAPPPAACALLRARPRTRTLAVSSDGRSGVIYELRPHREAVSELSAATVRRALRTAPLAGDREFSTCDPTPRIAP